MSALRCGAHLSEGDLLLAGELGYRNHEGTVAVRSGRQGGAGEGRTSAAGVRRARRHVSEEDRRGIERPQNPDARRRSMACRDGQAGAGAPGLILGRRK
jgi:hypothetical protein